MAAQRGAYRDMRADSTSVRSMGHLDDKSADATQARGSTDRPTIVGVRSGTVLDPTLVAEFRAVASRTDIAHRVLTILEPGQGSVLPASAERHGG